MIAGKSPERNKQGRVSSLWNNTTRKAKIIVGSVVTAVGFAAAVVGLYDKVFPPTPDERIRLVKESNTVVISSPDFGHQPIIADRVTVEGVVVAGAPVHIVANHLDFGASGRIEAREVTIFATRVTGGFLDVSGVDGDSSNRDGSHAGSVFVAAARFDRTRVDATGGPGANGSNGRDGLDGRNGDCAGFGKWQGAQRGGDGAPGEDGGDGGNGGSVTLLLSTLDGFPDPNVAGGNGGEPGKGGRGGAGGTGCAGLGGIQGDEPDGRNGIDGDPGTDGAAGTTVMRKIRFRDVSKLIRAAERTPQSISAVRQTLVRN